MKNKSKTNDSNSNKIEFKIFSNVRGQHLYGRAKASGIALCITEQKTSFFSSKVLNNNVRSDGTIKSVIDLL